MASSSQIHRTDTIHLEGQRSPDFTFFDAVVGRRAYHHIQLGLSHDFGHSLFGADIQLGVSHGYDGVAFGFQKLAQIAAQLPVGANQKHSHRVTSVGAMVATRTFICFSSLQWSSLRYQAPVGLDANEDVACTKPRSLNCASHSLQG